MLWKKISKRRFNQFQNKAKNFKQKIETLEVSNKTLQNTVES